MRYLLVVLLLSGCTAAKHKDEAILDIRMEMISKECQFILNRGERETGEDDSVELTQP